MLRSVMLLFVALLFLSVVHSSISLYSTVIITHSRSHRHVHTYNIHMYSIQSTPPTTMIYVRCTRWRYHIDMHLYRFVSLVSLVSLIPPLGNVCISATQYGGNNTRIARFLEHPSCVLLYHWHTGLDYKNIGAVSSVMSY
ncbi:hypothetical protein C8Q78DRAFT_460935 [Trametes maxima]|nr:hypothetical protein C8Q78DRAFT_460935 [Trametes maxima]